MDDGNDLPTRAAENPTVSLPAPATWRKPSVDEKLDEALRQTFPASDAFEISA
jgi:hypothetical protein